MESLYNGDTLLSILKAIPTLGKNFSARSAKIYA